nr:MAG TPA: hypothetical protein [Caudoviricetes sp.]
MIVSSPSMPHLRFDNYTINQLGLQQTNLHTIPVLTSFPPSPFKCPPE